MKRILTAIIICIVAAAHAPAQKPLAVDIWPEGLPNSNGTDLTEPYSDETRNYKPTMYVYLPDSNKATGREVTSDVANDYVLTNGLRGSDRHSDFEWAGWYANDGSFVLDLCKRTSIKRIVLGCINNSSMGVHIPAEIAISVSNDNKSFKQVAAKSYTHDEVFRTRTAIEDTEFDNLATSGRYVKVEFTNPGKCPKGDFKEGQDTWVYFDEIIVE